MAKKQHPLGSRAGDQTKQPDGTVLTICGHCGLWVAGDREKHYPFCPLRHLPRTPDGEVTR